MLRAICEIHEFPLQEGYGMFGDLISWFFSVSLSPYAESHMPEYLKAEMDGRDGNCNEYKNVCSKSLFKWEMERKPYHNEL
ncbi:Beta-defensin 18 [Orchesella cincta]|uniref:Beta-defensin 18 n=1 Tax=Orchesella cincta TaxID=48709 RepID=A0A1D2MD50_ORCCI|nr:Beta-defensin 18 [Orchesella cincta]